MMSALKPSFRPVYCFKTESVFNPIPDEVLDLYQSFGKEFEMMGRLTNWEMEAGFGNLVENFVVRTNEWGHRVVHTYLYHREAYTFDLGEEEALIDFLNRGLANIKEPNE